MGRKSEKKVKSDRVNALRKQYDAFLEDDKRRKERNEYILGKLDNIRYNSTAMQVRKPIVYGEVYPAYNRISYRPDHRAVQIPHPTEQIQHLNHRQLDVPAKYMDDTSLLKEISKKYILIPKLRPTLIDDFVETVPPHVIPPVVHNYGQSLPKNDVGSEDWKSKYDILEQLKNNENTDQANKYYAKEEPVKDEKIMSINDARKHNGDYNSQNIATKYDEEIPERDLSFIEATNKTNDLDHLKNSELNVEEPKTDPADALDGSIQENYEAEINYDLSLQSQDTIEKDANSAEEHDVKAAELNIENGSPSVTEIQSEPHQGEYMMQQAEQYQQEEQNIQELHPQEEEHPQVQDLQQEQYAQQEQYQQEQYPQQEQYDPQQYSQEHYAEQQYSQEQYADQQYQQEQYADQQYPQEQYSEQQYSQEEYSQQAPEQYSQEQHPSQQTEEEYRDLIHHETEAVYPEPEKVYLDKDDYSPIEVANPPITETNYEETMTGTTNNEDENKYPVELLNTEDFTPAEGVILKEGENVNPVYLASDKTEEPSYKNPTEMVNEQNVQPQPTDTGIEDFNAENKEMFYSEETNAYAYDQQIAGATENNQEYAVDENYDQNQGAVYYEGAEELQQQAYPVEINEHEETSTPYDQNYEQQYMNQYDEQGYQQQQEEITYEAPLEAYEPPQQQEYQYEQPDTVSVENIEKELDSEQGLASTHVGQTEKAAVKQSEKA